MSRGTDSSRRRFIKGAVGAVAAPVAVASVAGTAAAGGPFRIAATVVRTSHSKVEQGKLRIGARLTIMAADLTADNVVVVVDPVTFGASPAETRRQLESGIQRRAAEWLSRRGVDARAEDLAVQIFGLAA